MQAADEEAEATQRYQVRLAKCGYWLEGVKAVQRYQCVGECGWWLGWLGVGGVVVVDGGHPEVPGALGGVWVLVGWGFGVKQPGWMLTNQTSLSTITCPLPCRSSRTLITRGSEVKPQAGGQLQQVDISSWRARRQSVWAASCSPAAAQSSHAPAVDKGVEELLTGLLGSPGAKLMRPCDPADTSASQDALHAPCSTPCT